ncbi:hypothetical protein [Paenibacillus sp. HGF7]|uniref:hypothetical protein n=1 Tax=Paenibacillus sp. HGF7 TaxID=944559 RepID=UPI001478CDBA|nr:hypothetical protein [Paenibacillus sp. HGF7]
MPADSQSYGKLTLEEARFFAELALSQDKGLEKSVLIRLAYTTSIREGALLSLTERYNDNKFFHITPKTISAMMKKIRKQLGIPEYRNIVFHSLKTVAINWELETTGDIHRAKRQGKFGLNFVCSGCVCYSNFQSNR